MRPLWLSVVLASGRARIALVVASTALVSGLLLVAVSIARLGNGYVRQPLLGPIADPGTRPGSVLAVLLAGVPIAPLLDQCVRLGSAAQWRRYQALAVAGAGRRDLRRWGAVETGAPALAGALLGVPVWFALRLLLGDALADRGHGALVPTTTGPGPWALPVVGAITAYGVFVGRRAAVRAADSRRRESRPPRPWGPVLLLLALLTLGRAFGVGVPPARDTDPWTLAAVVLGVLGVATSTPWLAYLLAGRVGRRTDSAPTLLAASRIRADHGAAGRAAAAVGAVGLTLGVLGVFTTGLLDLQNQDLAYYVVPAVLVGIVAVLALAVITLSLSLHSIEATLERRREMSSLVATGVAPRVIEAANRTECLLVTLPITLLAGVVGAAVYVLGTPVGSAAALGGLAGVVVAGGAVWLAVQVAAGVTRPWLRDALAPDNLRTE